MLVLQNYEFNSHFLVPSFKKEERRRKKKPSEKWSAICGQKFPFTFSDPSFSGSAFPLWLPYHSFFFLFNFLFPIELCTNSFVLSYSGVNFSLFVGQCFFNNFLFTVHLKVMLVPNVCDNYFFKDLSRKIELHKLPARMTLEPDIDDTQWRFPHVFILPLECS